MRYWAVLLLSLFFPLTVHGVTNDALACWDFNESSGNAVDSTVNAYSLTNTNTIGYVSGKLNNAADSGNPNIAKRFNTSSYLGLVDTDPYTFNIWINMNAQPAANTEGHLINWADVSTVNKKIFYELKLYNNAGTMQVYINRNNVTTGTQTGVNQTFTVGTWYMLTYTWDGARHKLYVNGSGTALLDQASTITGSNSANVGDVDGYKVYVNAANILYGSFLTDVHTVYERVLTEAEITTLYNSGTGIECATILAASGGAPKVPDIIILSQNWGGNWVWPAGKRGHLGTQYLSPFLWNV